MGGVDPAGHGRGADSHMVAPQVPDKLTHLYGHELDMRTCGSFTGLCCGEGPHSAADGTVATLASRVTSVACPPGAF